MSAALSSSPAFEAAYFLARGEAPPSDTALDHSNMRTSDQPMLDQDHFSDVARKVFDRVDTAHTGKVTKSELGKAIVDPSYKGEQTQALVALYENFSLLHNLSNQQGWFDSPSISASDIDKFQSIEKVVAPLQFATTELKLWAEKDLTLFTGKDRDALTQADLDRALKDPATPKYDQEMLQLVHIFLPEMDPAHVASGLTKKDFEGLYDKTWNDKEGTLVASVYGSCWDVANQVQKAGTHYDLYGGQDPLKAITPDCVVQGAIGDCYFEAAAASIANCDPAVIRDCIADNHNGTYTVTFPGAKGEPIVVAAPTEAELGLYNRSGKNGLWSSVLEKAYGQYCENHAWWSSNTPQEGADGGGQPGPVMKLLTGKDYDFFEVPDTNQGEMAKYLSSAFSTTPAKVVVAGINNDLFGNWNGPDTPDTTSDNFDKGHDYSVTSFTASGKDDGTVGLRNPHGGKYGTPDGTIKIPLAEFMKNFSDVSIEK
jgi:hypothetical protein